MNLSILGVGSFWEEGRKERSQIWYNSTGILVHGKPIPSWKSGGKIRFNGYANFRPREERQVIGKVFACDYLPADERREWPLLFCRHKLPRPERPDYYLVAMDSLTFGSIDPSPDTMMSESCCLFSLSERRQEGESVQQALILMTAYNWVRTSTGTYFLQPDPHRPWLGQLEKKEIL